MSFLEDKRNLAMIILATILFTLAVTIVAVQRKAHEQRWLHNPVVEAPKMYNPQRPDPKSPVIPKTDRTLMDEAAKAQQSKIESAKVPK